MKLKCTSRLVNKIGDDYADFIVSNTDEVVASPRYYGFTSIEGFYFILRETSSASVYTYEYYRKPDSSTIADYSADWTARAAKSYQRYDLEFA